MNNNLYRAILSLAVFATAAMSLTPPATAHDAPETVTLFKNVKVFNGTENKLHDVDVLVVKNKIHKVAKNIPTAGTWEIDVKTGGKTFGSVFGETNGYTFTAEVEGEVKKVMVAVNVVDGGGKTLMPGLIDSHVHFNLSMPQGRLGMEMARWDTMASYAAAAALEWFYDGFTTVRDMGGMANGLQQVIDKGLMEGPRIYLSGGVISQTAGHGDMRLESQSELKYSSLYRNGMNQTADGPDEVRRAVRNNFSLGATQLKVMMAGGIASKASPFSSSQYTDEEILAAVDEAASRGTYVAVHLYLDEHIKRALDLGVMSIEHGQFLQEDTARLMKEKGAFISSFLASVQSDEILTHPVYGKPGTFENERTIMMKEGSAGFADVIRKVKPKLVFSSDIPSTSGMPARHQRDHEKWIFANSFGNFEALVAMTSMGGELAMLTGDLNPYPSKLGVIEEGAYADILIVDGNPLEDITVLGGNKEWFSAKPRERGIETINLIMKDGKIHKNTLK